MPCEVDSDSDANVIHSPSSKSNISRRYVEKKPITKHFNFHNVDLKTEKDCAEEIRLEKDDDTDKWSKAKIVNSDDDDYDDDYDDDEDEDEDDDDDESLQETWYELLAPSSYEKKKVKLFPV